MSVLFAHIAPTMAQRVYMLTARTAVTMTSRGAAFVFEELTIVTRVPLPLQILKQWDLNVRENKLVATGFQ